MTMTEKQMLSIQKEIDKINTQIQKKQAMIEKNLAKCEKLGCNDWTEDEWLEKRKTLSDKETAKGSFLLEFDKTLTQKQDSALWDRSNYQDDMKELKSKLENAEKRMAKATDKLYEVNLKVEEEQAIEQKEQSFISMWNNQDNKETYEEWLKRFKAECLLDGVVIDEAQNNWITGKTKAGKQFLMQINNGLTDRSWHCYTLWIDGEAIFTSGKFSTGYALIKK